MDAMSNNTVKRNRHISKRKLIENVFFGLLGLTFTVLVIGDPDAYIEIIKSNIIYTLIGVITGIGIFYFVELTAVGKAIETAFRESRLLTAAVLFGLLLVAVGIVELIENGNSELGVAWMIGFSVIVPAISVISYLWGRRSTADFDLS